MNETIKNLVERRSVREYLDKPVAEEALDLILEAGQYAASGKNVQKTVLVAVRDRATVELISRLNAQVLGIDGDPFYGARTVVVVFADRTWFTCVEDGSLVMGNMLAAAHSLGVDSCWIHRAREVFETEQGRELAEKWGIEDNYIGIGNCILGYRSGDYPRPKPRREGRIIKV